jgi:hypothetical protein
MVITITPTATPTPMPAFTPVLRVLLGADGLKLYAMANNCVVITTSVELLGGGARSNAGFVTQGTIFPRVVE